MLRGQRERNQTGGNLAELRKWHWGFREAEQAGICRAEFWKGESHGKELRNPVPPECRLRMGRVKHHGWVTDHPRVGS